MIGIFVLLVFLVACNTVPPEVIVIGKDSELPAFKSCSDLKDAFEEARDSGMNYGFVDEFMMVAEMAVPKAAGAMEATSADSQRAFSTTNIQVEGVDEADIIKTDGDYIYAVANNKLYVARAYPVEKAELISVTDLKDFNAQEIFIHHDRLLLFGSAYHDYARPMAKPAVGMPEIYPGPWSSGVVSLRLYTIADKKDPDVLRTVEFEGSYVSSRKIGSDVYFVVGSYPHWDNDCIVPLYSEDGDDFKEVAGCANVRYVPPVRASNFITVASISMTDEDKKIEREVIAGNGQNIYASLDNLYIAQTSWGREQKTTVSKFELKGGKVKFIVSGSVSGHILNQFSMDEYKGNFRIATTISGYSNNKDTSTNNIYVLDDDLEVIGEIEKIAPGESIYAARFMGDRAYLVTFRHVDPLFVIDLSDPRNPSILGKLKIPGYSEYLHPYDENHVIGIGKEVDASIDADKIHTENAVYYTAIQGVKLAIFDVSDVEHPVELHKEVIGDRGTESIAATDHKAFLFDKEKNLLVIPVVVAELPEGAPKNQMGDFVFQGAYVYDLTLKNGFNLRGKVTHYDDDSVFRKSGEYFSMDEGSIKRSIYIEDVLYTFSNKRIQLNSLKDLDKLKALDLPRDKEPEYYAVDEIMVR